MSDAPIDPRWSKILSLSVHELRTPISVVAGYLSMLLKERMGPLTPQQRHVIEEAQKSCGRLSGLADQLSELSTIERGDAPLKTQATDLHDVLRAAVENLPPLPDREVAIELALEDGPSPITADPARLGQSLGAIIAALRREVIGDDPLTIRERRSAGSYELHFGDGETLTALEGESDDGRGIFDEWRGGVGLTLAVARRIVNQHGGRLYAPPEGRRAGARLVLPR